MQSEKIEQERIATKWVLSTEQGRHFLWNLLGFCGVYRDFEGTGEEMIKQIGRRQVGLHLMATLADASEDQVMLMMKEAKNRDIEEKIKNDNANNASGTSSRSISVGDRPGDIYDTLIGGGDFASHSSGSAVDI